MGVLRAWGHSCWLGYGPNGIGSFARSVPGEVLLLLVAAAFVDIDAIFVFERLGEEGHGLGDDGAGCFRGDEGRSLEQGDGFVDLLLHCRSIAGNGGYSPTSSFSCARRSAISARGIWRYFSGSRLRRVHSLTAMSVCISISFG